MLGLHRSGGGAAGAESAAQATLSLPVPSLEKETAPSEPESGSSDDESHDVNHADNRLASAQRSCLEAGVKHVSTPTIKGGSKKPRKLAEISPKRAPLAL